MNTDKPGQDEHRAECTCKQRAPIPIEQWDGTYCLLCGEVLLDFSTWTEVMRTAPRPYSFRDAKDAQLERWAAEIGGTPPWEAEEETDDDPAAEPPTP